MKKKSGRQPLRGITENKKVLQKVDIAEALTKSGVPNGAHYHIIIPKGGSNEGNYLGSISESEYEDI